MCGLHVFFESKTKVPIMEITPLENFGAQAIWSCHQSPSLLTKHRKIKHLEISKTHTSLSFWPCQPVPFLPVYMSIVCRTSTPVVGDDRSHFLTYFPWQQKTTHWVSRDCLSNWFRSTSRPTQLASWPLQVPIKLLILAGIYSKASVDDQPTAVGRPRYLSVNASFSMWSTWRITVFISSLQFELKNTADLSRFTNWPDRCTGHLDQSPLEDKKVPQHTTGIDMVIWDHLVKSPVLVWTLLIVIH